MGAWVGTGATSRHAHWCASVCPSHLELIPWCQEGAQAPVSEAHHRRIAANVGKQHVVKLQAAKGAWLQPTCSTGMSSNAVLCRLSLDSSAVWQQSALSTHLDVPVDAAQIMGVSQRLQEAAHDASSCVLWHGTLHRGQAEWQACQSAALSAF